MSFVNGVKTGFETFATTITTLTNTVLLTLAYLLGAGITAITARLIGKTFLDRTAHWQAFTTYDDDPYRRF